MASFATAKERYLRGFRNPENGLPNPGTFSRLFRQSIRIGSEAFFQRFMTKLSLPSQEVIAIQGKCITPLVRQCYGKIALHATVPKLLEMLSLKGTIAPLSMRSIADVRCRASGISQSQYSSARISTANAVAPSNPRVKAVDSHRPLSFPSATRRYRRSCCAAR
jgi:hypothetical protein